MHATAHDCSAAHAQNIHPTYKSTSRWRSHQWRRAACPPLSHKMVDTMAAFESRVQERIGCFADTFDVCGAIFRGSEGMLTPLGAP